MTKKSIAMILTILLITLTIISLYSTFAFDEQNVKLDDSTANYNLIYSLKDSDYEEVIVNAGDELYVDLKVKNNYDSNVKYGACFRLVEPNSIPDGFSVTLSSTSVNTYEEVIKPNETKIISVKITNKSKSNVTIQLGTLVGFENGNINDLIKNNEILIK